MVVALRDMGQSTIAILSLALYTNGTFSSPLALDEHNFPIIR